jgi:hypothetical protein
MSVVYHFQFQNRTSTMSSKRARPDPVAGEEAADLDLYTGRMGFVTAGIKNGSQRQAPNAQGPASRDEKPDNYMSDGIDDDAGVGIISETFKNDTDIDNFLQQKARPVNDKLLEKLLGSKGARAKKKETNAAKAPAAAVKPTTVAKQNEDDSDEEGGRASAITSKRGGRGLPGHTRKAGAADRSSTEHTGSHVAPDHQSDEDEAESRQAMPAKSVKRKAAGGYLDELLAAKAKKKNKKKNGDGTTVGAG